MAWVPVAARLGRRAVAVRAQLQRGTPCPGLQRPRASGGSGVATGQRRRGLSARLAANTDTIFALSSGQGKAGVAVIRVSGDCAKAAATALVQGRMPRARQAALRTLVDPADNSVLDHALVLSFDGPHSFTGEDAVELHVHGGQAVVQAVLQALGALPSLRHARPGEFTRRAFFNSKLDLLQVEGLADLINAETAAQRRQALQHMGGESTGMLQGWRTDLLRCMAHVEAYIDFGEDDGIGDEDYQKALVEVGKLKETVKAYLDDNGCGERLRNGVAIAIVGPPNVGKSSLLNLLCRRDAAIVADMPGTTRDVLEIDADLRGFPIMFQDTAGVRFGAEVGPVEKEGVRRAQRAAAAADVLICLQDLTQPRCERLERGGGGRACLCEAHPTARTLVVGNKLDLVPGTHPQPSTSGSEAMPRAFSLSCHTRQGFDEFVAVLGDTVEALCTQTSFNGPAISRQRQRQHLQMLVTALEGIEDVDDDVVLVAEQLRATAEQFGHLTGHVGVEEILDILFAEFCIGK